MSRDLSIRKSWRKALAALSAPEEACHPPESRGGAVAEEQVTTKYSLASAPTTRPDKVNRFHFAAQRFGPASISRISASSTRGDFPSLMEMT